MQIRTRVVIVAGVMASLVYLTAQTSQPDGILYERALRHIEQARYLSARLTLNTLLHTYDTSGYAAWAKLAIANSWIREGGQNASSQADAEYKDFALFYPDSDDLRERVIVRPNGAASTLTKSLIQEISPVYPVDLLAQGIGETVQIAATVSKEGVPNSIRVINVPEHEEFASAALNAVRQWRYRPTLVGGQPIDVLTTVQINFKLNDR